MTIELKDEEAFSKEEFKVLVVDGQPVMEITNVNWVSGIRPFHEVEWSTNLLLNETVSLLKRAYLLTETRYNLNDPKFPSSKMNPYITLSENSLVDDAIEIPGQIFFSRKPEQWVGIEDVTISLTTPFYRLTLAVSPDKLDLEMTCKLKAGQKGIVDGATMVQMLVYANVPDIAAKIIKHTLQQPAQQSELEGIMAGLLSGYKIPEQIKENEKIKKKFF